ncbi:MAG: electron transfer flavoprotein subunit alpha/FixB family protein [Cetobacterium sp.]|uniref:electron transfer flavoprotein subunit alpha/FixB family protein n=1 Tax=unclassified Cetobacterium TaxID=2630983 RepID=UPI00163CF5C6|nr:electron transfer flavoprotein subunit alpha/FixB family protein [Cetobacterium sp. 8H]MBC2852101.1 electron transfer flavoprotein subunit alpha/FixB family protein [Cetobacterium sp. 8H]
MRSKVNQNINLQEYKGVWIIGEQRDSQIEPVTLELLGEGRKLATKINEELTLIICGEKLESEIEKLLDYPINNIIYLNNEQLKNYQTDSYVNLISKIIMKDKPNIVLIGATTIGRDLAPRLAGRVGTGLTADCTALEIDEVDKKLLQTRPAFGGNLMATIICPKNRPQMSTVRPGVMKKIEKENDFETKIIEPYLEEKLLFSRVQNAEIKLRNSSKIDLSQADVIVSGGRGIKGQIGVQLLQNLAECLGGTVGGSRAAVDSGWFEHERQIGQTGNTVRPKVYIACGISGAIQHVSGMGESDYIIAINKDEKAPIFSICDYGIVGDLFEVVPEMIKSFNNKR